MRQGLIIVGTGIQAAGQLTVEARNAITQADTVFFLVADPLTKHYLASLNTNCVSLHDCYSTDKPRMQSYLEMVGRIVDEVKSGKMVCVAFYGHPGVFAYPGHEAIRRLREDGIYARMVPGISAEDCLFADLGVDPAWSGCQSFEATDFLIFNRIFDPRCTLILWQVGVIGDTTFQAGGYRFQRGLSTLCRRLIDNYGEDHTAIIYEASHYPIYDARRDRVRLGDLASSTMTAESTLYVPGLATGRPDLAILTELGVSEDAITRIRVKVAS